MSTMALITLFLGSIQEGKASIMEESEALCVIQGVVSICPLSINEIIRWKFAAVALRLHSIVSSRPKAGSTGRAF